MYAKQVKWAFEGNRLRDCEILPEILGEAQGQWNNFKFLHMPCLLWSTDDRAL